MQSSKGEWAQRRTVQPSAVPQIVQRLAAFGAHAPVWRLGRRYAAGGATVRLSLKAPPEGAERDARELALGCRALRAGLPVTVAVEGLDDAIAAAHAVALSERFRRFAAAAGVDNGLLNLCLSASDLPPRAVRAASRPLLGRGPRYLMLSPTNVPLPAEESVWRLIHDPDGQKPRFWPALAAGTRSRCSLLPGEASRTLYPAFGIAAPRGSAWVPLSLDIGHVCGKRGELLERRFESTLDALVDLGDRLLDGLTWIDQRQATDARQNRRLAINVYGFGDLVVRRGDDPSDWGTLKWLDGLIARLHAGLWRRSRQLAARRGAVPALAEREPRGRWRDEAHRTAWRERWHQALLAEQVRHRNLLVLSPYAVLPRSIPAPPEFADLLPALLHADAFCFASAPQLKRWSASDLRSFYGRFQALIERHNAASFVAAGV